MLIFIRVRVPSLRHCQHAATADVTTSSHYGPYLAMLPKEQDFATLPLFWSSTARQELQGTAMGLELIALEAELHQLWNGTTGGSSKGGGLELGRADSVLCRVLTAVRDGTSSGQEENTKAAQEEQEGREQVEDVCSEARFRWAWAVITTRAFAPAILVPLQVRAA